jgi:5-methylcytosine-specific restriction endonuclease McrBC GTP-binding regulatory subunit McrB
MVVLNQPKLFIEIYSADIIKTLYKEFLPDGTDEKILLQSYVLCNAFKELKIVGLTVRSISSFLWDFYNKTFPVNEECPNVIFYGSPGTGKNYQVEKMKAYIMMNDDCYESVQFHPSFTYEDFIEGIKPKGVNKDGNITFGLVNGVFKEFCIKAKKERNKKHYFIVDEINRANLSTVFGEALSLLEKDYRHKADKPNENLIKTQYSSLIEDLIRESENKEKYIRLAYDYCEISKEVKFGIPDNVYFIGMMNDVDKSIDTFDLALRRRFKWIRKECDYNVIKDIVNDKNKHYLNIEDYSNACKKLNEYICDKLNLGKSYEFGHSFFMKITAIAKKEKISHEDMTKLFDDYLRPTLREYLRAFFSENEIDGKLQEALGEFIKNIKEKSHDQDKSK